MGRKLARTLALAAMLYAVCSCSIFTPVHNPLYRAGKPESPSGYVPRGVVEERIYPSSVPGPTARRMIVYLPEGYNDGDKRYPVAYILHGARGYETSWIKNADALRIADSLYAAGTAVKSILVFPNTNQYNDDKDFDGSRRKTALESIFEIDGTVEYAFVHDVVNYIDSLYRTIPDKEHRALAGLSIGGLQTIYISANNPDTFGSLGMFSPYTKTIRKPGPYNDFYKHLKDKHKTQFADPPQLYLITIGTADFFYPHIFNYRKYLTKNNYHFEYMQEKCGHDWPIWTDSYILFLENIFK